MIIKAKDGSTTRGLRPYTDKAALSHFLDSIDVDCSKSLSGFEGIRGEIPLSTIQGRISMFKAPGTRYMSQTTPDGLLIRRLA